MRRIFRKLEQEIFFVVIRYMKVTKHESDTSFQGNWHEKKLNKEHEKVLLDLIDELIAELDVTYTNANITTKKKKK